MSNFYGATSLIGGGDGALDAIDGNGVVDGSPLSNGDGAVVITNSLAYFYHLDAMHGGLESFPDIIAMDNNAGDKRWVLDKVYSDGLTSGCTVQLSGVQSLPTAETYYTIAFDTELFDVNNEFDTTTHKFTPTTAGYYLITLNVEVYSLGDNQYAETRIYKNGTAYMLGTGSAGGWTGSPSSIVLYLNGSTDYIEAKVKTGGSNKNVHADSWMSIAKF